jgi:hypothetical protein
MSAEKKSKKKRSGSKYSWIDKEISELQRQVNKITPQEKLQMRKFAKRFLPKKWGIHGGEEFIENWVRFSEEVESYYREEYDYGFYKLYHDFPEKKVNNYLILQYMVFLRKYALLPKGTFKVYRNIWDMEGPSFKRLGVHWTTKEAEKIGEFMFEAHINKKDVDWRKTLITNVYYPPEEEIWLKEKKKIFIDSYKTHDGEVVPVQKRYTTF